MGEPRVFGTREKEDEHDGRSIGACLGPLQRKEEDDFGLCLVPAYSSPINLILIVPPLPRTFVHRCLLCLCSFATDLPASA
jgi:hypothetical protein